MARIGIMGGTFDPIHKGHLMLGHQAYAEYKLDEIWFMPSGIPPHKTDHRITDTNDRCEMVRLAIAGTPYFKFSDFEVAREGNTYTAETLRLLKEEYPNHHFYFIIGADSLYEIETWYRPELVMSQTTLLVAGREYPNASCSMEERITDLKVRYHAEIFPLHCKEIPASSGDIRKMLAKEQSVKDYLPEAVEHYIIQKELYHS